MTAGKYRGIIFDLDGVLVFTDKLHYKAWKKIADSMGVPFDEEINNRLRGVSRMESLDIISEKSHKQFSQEEKQILSNEKNEHYKKLLNELSPSSIDDSTRKTLEALKRNGIKLAIGSSSKNAKQILEYTGLTKYFDAISDGTNISKSKPDPEVFQKAAAYLGLAPKDCLVVEDAVAGIDAAISGGFDSAGIGSAAKYNKAMYQIKRIDELMGFVK
jgi:beta-phosphoglucomutase